LVLLVPRELSEKHGRGLMLEGRAHQRNSTHPALQRHFRIRCSTSGFLEKKMRASFKATPTDGRNWSLDDPSTD